VVDLLIVTLYVLLITLPVHVACTMRIIKERKRMRILALTIWKLSGRNPNSPWRPKQKRKDK
jgi:hypothetical protein